MRMSCVISFGADATHPGFSSFTTAICEVPAHERRNGELLYDQKHLRSTVDSIHKAHSFSSLHSPSTNTAQV